jgi:hypothetical protein
MPPHSVQCSTYVARQFAVLVLSCLQYSRNTDKKGDDKSYRTKGPLEKAYRASTLATVSSTKRHKTQDILDILPAS